MSPLAVGLQFAGREVAALASMLEVAVEGAAPPGAHLVDAGDASLLVYVRTSATLADVARMAEAGRRVPHLLVDLAYHHTVSLGPLVVPGDTACLTCLAGRLGAAWGDAVPPEEPLAAGHVALVAGLLANELAKIAAGDRGLANRSVALDLAAYRLVEEAVLKHPWCPSCGAPAEERRSPRKAGAAAGDRG